MEHITIVDIIINMQIRYPSTFLSCGGIIKKINVAIITKAPTIHIIHMFRGIGVFGGPAFASTFEYSLFDAILFSPFHYNLLAI